MLNALLVFLGGGLGAVARYGLAAWLDGGPDGSDPLKRVVGEDFPIGTLAVNLLGCLLIGVTGGVLLAMEQGGSERAQHRLLLVVGLLGGFTTFSSFALDAVNLVQQQRVAHAVGYVLVSNVLGIAAAVIGGWGTAALVGTGAGGR